MRLSDQSLQHRTVITADGRAIGEVSALFLDAETWKVESLQVTLRKGIADRLGTPRTFFHAGTIEVPVRLVQSVSDAVVLELDVVALHQLLSGTGPVANGSTDQPPTSH